MQEDLQIADSERGQWGLTQPLRSVVGAVLMFMGGLLIIGMILVPLDNNSSMWGFGHGPVCADASLNGLSQGGGGNILVHMRAGATSGESAVQVCTTRPTTGQRVLVTLTQAPGAVLYLAILLLLLRLLFTAGRTGPFAVQVARRLRFLAWFILAGSLAVAIGQDLARSFFVSTTVTDQVPVIDNAVIAAIRGIFPPLLIVCGLLTLARVIRVGAQMNDDIAGTV